MVGNVRCHFTLGNAKSNYPTFVEKHFFNEFAIGLAKSNDPNIMIL